MGVLKRLFPICFAVEEYLVINLFIYKLFWNSFLLPCFEVEENLTIKLFIYKLFDNKIVFYVHYKYVKIYIIGV